MKRQKPQREVSTQPIVRINFKPDSNPEPQKTTISFKIQADPDPEQFDDDIEVLLSEKDDDYSQIREQTKKSKKVKK